MTRGPTCWGRDVHSVFKSPLLNVLSRQAKTHEMRFARTTIYMGKCAVCMYSCPSCYEVVHLELTTRTPSILPLPHCCFAFDVALASGPHDPLARRWGCCDTHSETQNLGGSSCLYTCALRPAAIYGTKEDRSVQRVFFVSRTVRVYPIRHE